MKVLVTGGAGFIGRWVVRELLQEHHEVWVLDNLSNGRVENLNELFADSKALHLQIGDIKNVTTLSTLFKNDFDLCFHLAASINVQDSIDDPSTVFANDTVGTFNVLEKCREYSVKLIFMSTCMVYDTASDTNGITEEHPTKPTSPYAGSKIAAENMVLSYYYAYGLPIVVVRPFNTYGPFQRSGGEGGVVAIFIKNKLADHKITIYGDGTQTRDLLYVEDCARFVVAAGYSDQVNGHIVNAGLGQDVSINVLANMVMREQNRIQYVSHIHPQSEIQKLLCNYAKAKIILNWEPTVSLEQGLRITESWMIEEYLKHGTE